MEYKETDGAEKWIWSITPQLARLYHDFHQVLSNSTAYDKAPTLVGLLFDIGEQLLFASIKYGSKLVNQQPVGRSGQRRGTHRLS